MALLQTNEFSDKFLEDYDKLMVQATIRIEQFSALSILIWIDVLKELDARGKVTLVSGSYDDIGNSLITRHF